MKHTDDGGNDESVQAIFCALERAFFKAGDELADRDSGGATSASGSSEREALTAARPGLVGAALVGCVGCAITLVLSLS